MRSARVLACLAACALLLYVPVTYGARPLQLLSENQQDDDWQTARSSFLRDGSILNWLDEQLDSVEGLLSEARNGGSQLQRQDAFKEQSQAWVQDVMRQLGRDGMPQQEEQGRSDTELGSASQAYSGMTSGDGAQSSMSIQVEQGPDGSVTTTTTTDDGRGGRSTSTSYSMDGSMSAVDEGGSSSSSSSSSSDDSDSSEARQAAVQSAYDEHVAERIQDVRAQLARGELSTAQAEDLMAFFTSQTYLNSWVRQHMQEEQQRQRDLALVLQQQQLQLLPQELFTGPIFNLMDLLLAPIQSISSGCKHKQQQQQQQQQQQLMAQQPVAAADDSDQPMMRVTLIQGSSGEDSSRSSSRGSAHASGSVRGSYPPWQLCLFALLAGMLALSTLCQAVKYMMIWRRERAELKAHLLDSEACAPPPDVAGAKVLPSGEYTKPVKQQQQQQQQQQPQQPQYVSNIVFAKDHAHADQ